MRIVAWNVNCMTDRKLAALRSLRPDVAVISECSSELDLLSGESFVWCGRNSDRGLGVVAFGSWHVDRLVEADPIEEWILPVTVGGPVPFNLLAVWATTSREYLKATEGPGAVGPLRLALQRHRRFMTKADAVVAGDFNNGAKWDEPLKPSSHAYGVADLASFGLVSAYHRDRRCEQGAEEDATWYMHRDEQKPYHIDFCFVPKAWTIERVEIGEYADYCHVGGLSDHAPVVVDCRPD